MKVVMILSAYRRLPASTRLVRMHRFLHRKTSCPHISEGLPELFYRRYRLCSVHRCKPCEAVLLARPYWSGVVRAAFLSSARQQAVIGTPLEQPTNRWLPAYASARVLRGRNFWCMHSA